MRWVRMEGGFLRLYSCHHLLMLLPNMYIASEESNNSNNNNNNNSQVRHTRYVRHTYVTKVRTNIYAPRYAIRTSQRVRTHSCFHTYATGEPVPLHTCK